MDGWIKLGATKRYRNYSSFLQRLLWAGAWRWRIGTNVPQRDVVARAITIIEGTNTTTAV